MGASCRDFTELVLRAEKDRDYRLVIWDRGAEITLVAIHGGGIEPMTSELAAAVAGEAYNLYDLQGLLPQGNDVFRIPAHRFDEMRLRVLLGRSQAAVSLDGVEGAEPLLRLGGRNRRLKAILAEALAQAGFATADPAGIKPAHDPALFFNRPAEGGVQIELTRALRESMSDTWSKDGNGQERFQACAAALREGLERYRLERRTDLDHALERFERDTRAFPRALRAGSPRHPQQRPSDDE